MADAEIVPLRATDVHYEVALDDEPESPQPFGEIVLDVPDDRLPVVPEWMQPEQLRFHAERLAYAAKAHAVRAPFMYLPLTMVWAVAGLFKLIGRQLHWWWLLEQHGLRSQAAADGDPREWKSLHKVAQETRKTRGMVLLAEVAGVAAGVSLLARSGKWWLWPPVIAAVLVFLARQGRPAGKPIIRPVMTTPRFRLINLDVVLRAMYAAGLGSYDKPGQQVTFPAGAQRDAEGSRVLVDLPYGKSLKDAVAVRHAIASGLDVTESQVYLHRDPTSARRFMLWVADRDPLAVPVGRTPLLACRQTDIWKPAPIGLDERGQLVRVPMMWNSLLVGALPRQGKTFTARQLALYCALDPYVQMDVFDAAGKPDWRKFSLVADSCAFGLTPTKDGLPPEILLATLDGIKDDVQARYHALSELADKRADLCPEGKLTRDLARDPRWNMPVRVLILDEVQEYFDLGDISKEIAKLLVFLVKVAPGAGVILVAATQKPSGIGGTGNVGTQWMSFRDQFGLRFSLRTASRDVSEMVLGAGAYGEGLDSSKLLPEYKGVGILRNASDKSPTVRTYYADGADAERILTVARAIRERAGTLSGMAAGEQGEQPRDVLADVLAVFTGETGLQWADLAERLAKRFPDRWADVTSDAISAQVRGLGVPGAQVWSRGSNQQGCKRMDVQQAAGRA